MQVSVSVELWSLVTPLLPPEPPESKGSLLRVSDLAAMAGVIFVLKTGIPGGRCPNNSAPLVGDVLPAEPRQGGSWRLGSASLRTFRLPRRSRRPIDVRRTNVGIAVNAPRIGKPSPDTLTLCCKTVQGLGG